jgi:hypothetical protein
MQSKVAKEAERTLIEASQGLRPEQRLQAFLRHCRFVAELYEAGRKIRSARTQQKQ